MATFIIPSGDSQAMRRALALVLLVAVAAGCAEAPPPSADDVAPLPPPLDLPPVTPPEEPRLPSPTPITVPTPSPPRGNRTSILPNGGFEEGEGTSAAGWSLQYGASRECGFDPRAGECAAHLRPGAQATVTLRDVSAGQLVWLEFFAMGGNGELKATMLASDGARAMGAETRLHQLPYEYRYHLLGPLLVPDGAAEVQVIFGSGGANDTRLDEVAVYVATPMAAQLSNGGFELGDGIRASGWEQHNAYRDCTRAHEGECSVRLEHASGSRIAQSFGPRGAVLHLPLARQAEGAAQLWVNLTFRAEDGSVTGRSGGASMNVLTDWVEGGGRQQIPVGTSRIELVIEAGFAEGALSWIDDVRAEWSSSGP